MWAVFTYKMSISKTIFDANFDVLDEIRELVGEIAHQAGFSDRDIYSIQLATDEASSNIIEHAYEGIKDGKFELECDTSNDELRIVMRDQGKPFNPSSVPEPNVHADLADRQIGGLGMYLMRKLMDEVSYQSFSDAGNVLTMIKRKGESE